MSVRSIHCLCKGFRNKIDIGGIFFEGGPNELYWGRAIGFFFGGGGVILEQPSSETYIYFFQICSM